MRAFPADSTSSQSMFGRCGVATVADLDDPEYRSVFAELETKQAKFLAAQSRFRSPGYRWPSDALHNWSRIWEYPYIYRQLEQYARKNSGRKLMAADIGSGVTFMPFAAADLGYEVCCVDTDPIVGTDLGRAVDALGYQQSQIYYRPTDGSRLPLDDHSLDSLFCISVLEHVPDPVQLVSEFRRVLKPEGQLLLTIDLALKGAAEITPPNHARLIQSLEQEFQFALPISLTHPGEVLTSRNGPYRLYSFQMNLRRIVVYSYYSFWKALGQDCEPVLSCEGLVLEPQRAAA